MGIASNRLEQLGSGEDDHALRVTLIAAGAPTVLVSDLRGCSESRKVIGNAPVQATDRNPRSEHQHKTELGSVAEVLESAVIVVITAGRLPRIRPGHPRRRPRYSIIRYDDGCRMMVTINVKSHIGHWQS